jgi:hypothetical protein
MQPRVGDPDLAELDPTFARLRVAGDDTDVIELFHGGHSPV